MTKFKYAIIPLSLMFSISASASIVSEKHSKDIDDLIKSSELTDSDFLEFTATILNTKPEENTKVEEKVKLESNGGLLVSNIPEDSEVVFHEEFKILPKENVMFFDDGARVYSNPVKNEKFLTYCFFQLTDSGAGRKINKGKSFKINNVSSVYSEKNFDVYGDVTIQKVEFDLDNDHLRKLTCFSSQKDKPLIIDDIYYESGSSFSIKLSDYISI